MYAEIPDLTEELAVDGGAPVVPRTDRGPVLVKARATHHPNAEEVFPLPLGRHRPG